RALAELSDGLRTRLAEGGAGLSKGQQTRLMLARAVLGGPRLLLLDEADAHLDPATIRLLREAIASYGGTVVCATHRPELLDLADSVWEAAERRVRARQFAS